MMLAPSARTPAEAAFLKAIDALEREVRCPICLDPLNDPHLISSCKHSFCKQCCTAALADAENCPLCRAPASRRSCRPDEFMAGMVATVIGTCRQLREGATLELDSPAPDAWRGRAPEAVDTGPYLARAAQPLQLGQILAIHDDISRKADELARVNRAFGSVLTESEQLAMHPAPAPAPAPALAPTRPSMVSSEAAGTPLPPPPPPSTCAPPCAPPPSRLSSAQADDGAAPAAGAHERSSDCGRDGFAGALRTELLVIWTERLAGCKDVAHSWDVDCDVDEVDDVLRVRDERAGEENHGSGRGAIRLRVCSRRANEGHPQAQRLPNAAFDASSSLFISVPAPVP